MQPNIKLVTILDNEKKIKELLEELVLQPRLNALKWSAITKQTPNIKIGYPGQHLASLITGMTGERTGARGNDLIDGSEVKSCSRIDQLDLCLECKSPVARHEEKCSNCGSSNVSRKNDSKWLFSIRNEDELNFLLHGVKRVLLVIGDYPSFDSGNFETLRFQTYEIWPESSRNKRFSEIMTNYYHKIYLAHKKKSSNKNPAPKNFWPNQYQFYMCNPVLTFSCIVENANTKPSIKISHYVNPKEDRSTLPSVLMPVAILNDGEIGVIRRKAKDDEILNMISQEAKAHIKNVKRTPVSELRKVFMGVDETLRQYLPLRDTDKISTAKSKYSRRSYSEES